MYVLKNALKNIGRNKGRNGLVVLLLSVIVLGSSVSIIINMAVGEAIQDFRNRFGVEARLVLNFDEWIARRERGEETPPPTPKQLLAFGESEHLHSVAYSGRLTIFFDGLTPLWAEAEENHGEKEENHEFEILGDAPAFIMPDGWLRGSIGDRRSRGDGADSLFEDFENGSRRIIDGRFFEGIDESLVSEEFAALNQLEIGDTLTVKSNELTHELTIVGIFEDFTMERVSPHIPQNSLNHLGNEILVSFETLIEMELFHQDPHAWLEATFHLKEPERLEDFFEEIIELGLPDHYKVTTDEMAYHAVIRPVENLGEIFTTFMVVVLVLGGTVLLVISLVFIRERKYEIGVLRSMGMKKSQVAFGLIYESLGVTSLALVLGLSLASVMAQPIADRILAIQVELIEQLNDDNGVSFISMEGGELVSETPEPALANLSIRLKPKAMGQIISLALCLSIISGLVSVFYLMKHEPMKILTERG